MLCHTHTTAAAAASLQVGLDSDIQSMTDLDELLADPQHCEQYMNFINSHQSAENPEKVTET